MLCGIWYHLCNLKNVKNTHGEILLLVKLQAASYIIEIYEEPQNVVKINSHMNHAKTVFALKLVNSGNFSG